MGNNLGPTLKKSVQKFARWQTQRDSTIHRGLTLIQEATFADLVTLTKYSADGACLVHLETSSPQSSDITDLTTILQTPFQGQQSTDPDNWTQHQTNGNYSFCLCQPPITEEDGQSWQLCLWNRRGFQSNDATFIFLDMAYSSLIEKTKTLNNNNEEEGFLQEALDAIKDGFILFDKAEKIIAFNKAQHQLFPSIKDTIKINGHYEDILQRQCEMGVLDVARLGGNDWIEQRRAQLSIPDYTTEQKFLDGRTIRLKNYKTPSGNTVAVRSDITELVNARQNAVDNEILFRTLLVEAPIPLTIDIDGIFVYANSFAHTLIELKNQEMVGRKITDFYWQPNTRRDFHRQKLERKAQGYYELEIKTNSGKKKIVWVTTTPIIYQGQKAHFTSFLDTTDAALTRTALANSEKQNRDLLELVPDALVIQVKGKIVFVNHSAVEIFGAKGKNEIIGMSGIDLSPKEERHRVLSIRQSATKKHFSSAKNTRHLKMDQTVFHSEMFAVEVNWNGQPGTMNIIRDKTQQHEYESSLLQKEKEMSIAQEIGHLGHWRINIAAQTVFWSDELYRIHRLNPETDILDLDRAIAFVVEEDRHKLTDLINETIKTQKPHHTEAQSKLDNGNIRCMSISMRPEMGENNRVVSVFGVTQDVTEQRILEEKLRQSQKMEAIGQLTGGVAHDFNNLLAVIQGNAELLLDLEDKLDEQTINHLEAIIRASGRGADLTRNMLAYSRKQSLKPTLTNLDSQVERMIKILRRTLGQNIQIHFASDAALWSCVADPAQVEAALLNLALNARDAMPDGGVLTIETRNIALNKNSRDFDEDFVPGKYVMLSVRDTGIGISAKDIKKVFEPFFTTKETGKGTGLGLSMIYGFTKQSGGQIAIASRLKQGTTVEIFLPHLENKPVVETD